jgi:hypothetical protein
VGTFLVEEKRGDRWAAVALFYTREAAERCVKMYQDAGRTVRIV